MLNAHALAVMLIHFLQQRRHLPCIRADMERPETGVAIMHDMGNKWFGSTDEPVPITTENVGALLQDFFVYWAATFNFDQVSGWCEPKIINYCACCVYGSDCHLCMLCVLITGSCTVGVEIESLHVATCCLLSQYVCSLRSNTLTKAAKGWHGIEHGVFAIEDPVELDRNLAAKLSPRMVYTLKLECARASLLLSGSVSQYNEWCSRTLCRLVHADYMWVSELPMYEVLAAEMTSAAPAPCTAAVACTDPSPPTIIHALVRQKRKRSFGRFLAGDAVVLEQSITANATKVQTTVDAKAAFEHLSNIPLLVIMAECTCT